MTSTVWWFPLITVCVCTILIYLFYNAIYIHTEDSIARNLNKFITDHFKSWNIKFFCKVNGNCSTLYHIILDKGCTAVQAFLAHFKKIMKKCHILSLMNLACSFENSNAFFRWHNLSKLNAWNKAQFYQENMVNHAVCMRGKENRELPLTLRNAKAVKKQGEVGFWGNTLSLLSFSLPLSLSLSLFMASL